MEWIEVEFKGAVPSIRNSHRSVVKDDLVLIHGGRGGSSTLKDLHLLSTGHEDDDHEWYRPFMRGNIPARENHALEISNGLIYLFGGNMNGALSNDLFVLDTNTWTWSLIPTSGDIPTPRERHTMSAVGNRMFVFGGHDEKNDYLNDMYILDLETRIWISAPSSPKAPIPRQLHSASVVGELIYIFGGKSSSGCFGDLAVFDTKLLTWEHLSADGIFPAGRWGHSATVVKDHIVIFGGWNGTWCFNDTHVFDTKNSSWKAIQIRGIFPAARAYHSLACVGERLFLFGGRDGLRRMKDTCVLDARKLFLQESDQILDLPIKTEKFERLGLPTDYKWNLADFEFKCTLGTGSFGRVKLAKHLPTGKTCAVKCLKKSEIIRLKQVDHILAEKAILSSIDHPFIVNIFGHFQDRKYLYLVMEFVVGGEFFTHLRRAGRFNNDSSCFYAAQIVLIFQYLHSQDIVYRDLKPENLLLDHTGNVKLTDFGFAKKVDYRTWTLCGTPEYIAPEILLNKGHGKPVDWWALGILIYEMLAGCPPFVDDDPMGIYQKILAGRISFPRYFDKDAKDLIRKLLVADVTKRLGNLKGGVEEIKQHKWFDKIDWAKLYNREMRVPFIPDVKAMDSPNNFEKYPENTPEPPSINTESDPFKSF